MLWLAEFLLPLQGQQQHTITILHTYIVVISWIFTTFTGSTTTRQPRTAYRQPLWLAEFLLPLQGQQQPIVCNPKHLFVVISWIFTTFTGSTTTSPFFYAERQGLWLAEFLLPLQGQQQRCSRNISIGNVVISWIFTTFTGSTTTFEQALIGSRQLWLAEFLLPLQGQQQLCNPVFGHNDVVISWIFTTFTGSTTTPKSPWCLPILLWLAEFLLPLQGQQQLGHWADFEVYVVISWIFTTFTGSTTTQTYVGVRIGSLWLAEFLLPLQGQQQLYRAYR